MAIEGALGEVTGDDRNDCGGVNSGIGEQVTGFGVCSSSLIKGRVGGGEDGGSDAVGVVVVGDEQWIGEVCSEGGDETHNARNSV